MYIDSTMVDGYRESGTDNITTKSPPGSDLRELEGEVNRKGSTPSGRQAGDNVDNTIGHVDSSPHEVTTSVPLAVEASSNYLSLKGDATPGDRGEESETIHGSRGEVNREATTASGKKSTTGPRVEPVADLREAEGQLNRGGSTPSGTEVVLEGEGRNWTSSGDVVKGFKDDNGYNHDIGMGILIDDSILDVDDIVDECRMILMNVLKRLMIILLLFISSIYVQGLLMLMSDLYYLKNPSIPLQDRLHKLLRPIGEIISIKVGNIMISILVIISSLRILLFTPLIYSLNIVIRLFFLESILYFIRGIFIYMTTIPSPNPYCIPYDCNGTHLEYIYEIIKGYFGYRESCTDLIISGHTMSTLIFTIILLQNISSIIFKICILLYILFIYIIIIATKFHYTIDVLFGILISTSIYYYYYYNIINHNNKSNYNIISYYLSQIEQIPSRIIITNKLQQLQQTYQYNNHIINKYFHWFGINQYNQIYTGYTHFNTYYFKEIHSQLSIIYNNLKKKITIK